jgi:hypothetical protein
VDYFYGGSTSASNIREVIAGSGSVSPFVEYEVVNTGRGARATSLIEDSPEDYIGRELDRVRVRTLEE